MRKAGMLIALACVVACGGGGSSAPVQPPSSVTISPESTDVEVLQQKQFDAVAVPAGPVTWSATRGTIDANGLYTAPDTVGDVTITATLNSEPSISDFSTLVVHFTKSVDVVLHNASSAPVRMYFGPGGTEVGPGNSVNLGGPILWSSEVEPFHFEVTVTRVGLPPVIGDLPVSVAEARDPAFTRVTAVFDGTTVTVTRI